MEGAEFFHPAGENGKGQAEEDNLTAFNAWEMDGGQTSFGIWFLLTTWDIA